MSVVIVVGAQWGDEGKGKVVDLFTERADVVVRYGGGANAGHTLVIGGKKLVTHLVPSGVCHPGKACVLGDGMVIDPHTLLDEIKDCQDRGLLVRNELLIGLGAHVILPYHKLVDGLREDHGAKQGKAIGTTRRGIGPAYEMKAARRGIRVRDLLKPARLRELVAANVDDLAPLIQHLGRHVLFEGAQGCLLDVDHGTYPYVTSSSTIAAGACQSAGIGPTQIDSVVGITKAYATRVGEGPFPTELHGEMGERLRKAGGEYGATTGRPRRCGWLDLPALRMGVRLSGMQSLALTKLDVLAGLPEVSVCVAYKLDGKELAEPPTDPDDLSRAEPIYARLPGWGALPSDARDVTDLPAPARSYVETIERMAGVPFCLVSVGPDRSETIRLHDPFA